MALAFFIAIQFLGFLNIFGMVASWSSLLQEEILEKERTIGELNASETIADFVARFEKTWYTCINFTERGEL